MATEQMNNIFAEGITDISPDIVVNEKDRTITVFPEMSDKALESIAKEAGLLEKAGATTIEETFGTDIAFDISAEINENREVTAEITMRTDTESITVQIPSAQEITDAVIETTEQHLHDCDSSIQKEFDEMEKESFQKGE